MVTVLGLMRNDPGLGPNGRMRITGLRDFGQHLAAILSEVPARAKKAAQAVAERQTVAEKKARIAAVLKCQEEREIKLVNYMAQFYATGVEPREARRLAREMLEREEAGDTGAVTGPIATQPEKPTVQADPPAPAQTTDSDPRPAEGADGRTARAQQADEVCQASCEGLELPVVDRPDPTSGELKVTEELCTPRPDREALSTEKNAVFGLMRNDPSLSNQVGITRLGESTQHLPVIVSEVPARAKQQEARAAPAVERQTRYEERELKLADYAGRFYAAGVTDPRAARQLATETLECEEAGEAVALPDPVTVKPDQSSLRIGKMFRPVELPRLGLDAALDAANIRRPRVRLSRVDLNATEARETEQHIRYNRLLIELVNAGVPRDEVREKAAAMVVASLSPADGGQPAEEL
jgi:hypothetical protein